MVLGVIEVAAVALTPVAHAATWARFVDQVMAQSKAAMPNAMQDRPGAIIRVASHSIALIVLNFAFFSYMGHISMSVVIVGGTGLTLVPLVWALLYGTRQINTPEFQQGIRIMMDMNVVASVAAAAAFIFSGKLFFGAMLGSFLVVGALRRRFLLPMHLVRNTERVEFAIANTAGLLIGTGALYAFHKLRVVLDVALRLHAYYIPKIKTEPITLDVKAVEGFSYSKCSSIEEFKSIPTADHINWEALEAPKKAPSDVSMDDYTQAAKKALQQHFIGRIRGALQEYDDHSEEYLCQGDAAVLNKAKDKVGSWIDEVKNGNSAFPDQTKKIQIYALHILKKIEELIDTGECEDAAYYLTRLTGNCSPSVTYCQEGLLNTTETVYGELFTPHLSTIKQKMSFVLQGLRLHLLHRFIFKKSKEFEFKGFNFIASADELHLVNIFLSTLNQRGFTLGLPEEEAARLDRYYRGSLIVEPFVWSATKDFKDWFLDHYTLETMIEHMKNSQWKSEFIGEIHKGIRTSNEESSSDLTASAIRPLRRAYEGGDRGIEGGNPQVKSNYYKSLLVDMGVLSFSNEDKAQLKEPLIK